MGLIIKVIFIILLILSCGLICILNAHKNEIWEKLYKKLGLKWQIESKIIKDN